MRLHHVQVSAPPGGEEAARRFWLALGLAEVEKPEPLRGRGGCWFRAYDAVGAVTAEVHVGIEDTFTPARKAHPALLLDSVAELEAAAARLEAGGFPVDRTEWGTFAPYVRVHCFDGHGSRVELLAPPATGTDEVTDG